MDYSPALSINSDMSDEELEKYFASYIPLSNLPTPPPAKEHVPNQPSTPTLSTSQTLNQTYDISSPPEHQG
jgi:hypothetical protein